MVSALLSKNTLKLKNLPQLDDIDKCQSFWELWSNIKSKKTL